MELIVGPRQSGKTTKVIEWLLDQNTDQVRGVLFPSIARQESFIKQLLSYIPVEDIPYDRLLTPGSITYGKLPQMVVAIDELEPFIQSLLPHRVVLATGTFDLGLLSFPDNSEDDF